MPAIGFICPDQQRITFRNCFEKCRLEEDLPMGRCKAIPYLRKIAVQREWTGTPSTTQLIGGTREAFLKITKPYFIDPEKRIFMFHGTNVHWIIEKFGGEGDEFSEERLGDEICTGAFDFYDGSQQILYDYKTWGSYKVMQALGIKKKDGIPILDDSGEPVVYKTGPKRGQTKTKSIFIEGDLVTRCFALFETSIQLSNYRDKLLTILPKGYGVKKMAIQVISRDAGLQVARQRNVTVNAPLIPVNGMSKVWVDRYLSRKRDLLLTALEQGFAPICRRRERWDKDKKCIDYCDVHDHCAHYVQNLMGKGA